MGDAFLVEFHSAPEAARCSYDIQGAIREFNISLPDERRIHLRVGIHLGDVVEPTGDISGDAVNIYRGLSRCQKIAVSASPNRSTNRSRQVRVPVGEHGLKIIEELRPTNLVSVGAAVGSVYSALRDLGARVRTFLKVL